MALKLAPIVLFTYNRIYHLRRTIEALQINTLAKDSELFIFSDGPKLDIEDEYKVKAVREFLKTIKGFKSVTVIERDKNWGLGDNIIDGVTQVVNAYDKVIVLEDDIFTSPYFLKFMNEALDIYKDEEKVMHISGFIYRIRKGRLPDTFFLKPAACWGWATWKRAWRFFCKAPEKQIKLLNEKQIKDFNLDNSYNYWSQVISNYRGKINTWGVFWYLSVYLQNGLSLFPRDSLAMHIGFDSGSNISSKHRDPFSQEELLLKDRWDFPKSIEENKLAKKRLKEFFHKSPYGMNSRFSLLKKNVSNVLKFILGDNLYEKVKKAKKYIYS